MNCKTLLFFFFLFISQTLLATGGVLPGSGTDLDPFRVEDYADLKMVGTTATYTKAKVYKLTTNIDASASATENGGLGFIPLSNSGAQFTGKFHGSGKTISNLTINRPTSDYVGLFGYLNTNAVIDSVGIVNSYIKGKSYVSAVAGYAKNSTINSCYNNDSVISVLNYAGGVVGFSSGGTITNCYNLGPVLAIESVGGIVGNTTLATVLSNCYNNAPIYASVRYAGGLAGRTTNGSITTCFNYGNVSTTTYAGGLVSSTSGTIITSCYSIGSISGNSYIGGLFGNTSGGTITKSYSTGDVLGESFVGGFAGYISSSTIRNAYSIGDVIGNTASIGGFTGQVFTATLDSCYSAGSFKGALNSGGFIGTHFNGNIFNCYYNTETTGTTKDVGLELTPANPITGLTVAQMKNNTSISIFDYSSIWDIRNDSIYPALRNINNAPFAYNDTLVVSASSLISGVNYSSFIDNDFDFETLQDSLVYRIKDISNGTTDSISNMYFFPSVANGDTITLIYRIGEKNALLPDTLWGSTAKIIAIMDDTAPVFTSSILNTIEDSITVFKLGVIDTDNDSIILSILDSTLHASVVLNKDTLVFTPDANFFGTDSIRILISDSLLQNSTWIKINVLAINDAPIARDTLINWVAGLPLNLPLPVTDVDDSSSFGHINVSPSNGSASINITDLSYTSSPFYVGKDTIQWYATDPNNLSSDTVSLIINLSAAVLSLSEDTIEIQSPGETVNSVSVASNTAWTAVASESWVSLDPTTLIGNSDLTIIVSNNPYGVDREATITFTASGVTPKVLKIIQDKKIFITMSLSGTFESCDDSPILLDYTKQFGSPTQYRLLYEAEALAVGFTDTGYANLPAGSSGTISINIPVSAPYGNYIGNIQFRNALGIESDYYPFIFYKSLPESYVLHSSNTVLTIDNQSYNFIGYQWYKDGILLPNETYPFYTDMEGFDGSYKAKLWTSNGDSLFTCEKYINNYAISNKIARVYPNPVRQHEPFTIEFSDPITRKFSVVSIDIFDTSGKLAYSTKANNGKTVLSFNKQPGMYVIHLSLDFGEDYSYYLIVTE